MRWSAAAYPGAPPTPVRAILLVVGRVFASLEVLAAVRALPHPRWRIASLLHCHRWIFRFIVFLDLPGSGLRKSPDGSETLSAVPALERQE